MDAVEVQYFNDIGSAMTALGQTKRAASANRSGGLYQGRRGFYAVPAASAVVGGMDGLHADQVAALEVVPPCDGSDPKFIALRDGTPLATKAPLTARREAESGRA